MHGPRDPDHCRSLDVNVKALEEGKNKKLPHFGSEIT
jgi:hypothetical protein